MHIQNVVTLEKYLNLFLKNSCLKLINFESFFDGKVPKISVFNQCVFGKKINLDT